MVPLLIDHNLRRLEIVEATWRVIVRDGIGAVSTRNVAIEANVSTGSLRHVFPRHEDLLVAAMQHVRVKATHRVRALPRTLVGMERGRAIAHELLPLDEERRAELEVQLSLVALAHSNPALRAVRDSTNEAVLDGCRHVVALVTGKNVPPASAPESDTSPSATSERHAQHLHALLDGVAVHLLHASAALSPQDAIDILDEYLESLTPNQLGTGGNHV